MFNTQIKSILVVISFGFFAISCGDDNLGNFQQNTADPQVQLWEILDDTPALKSLFTKIDPSDFNVKMDEILRSNPALMTETMRTTADTFYGAKEKAVVPRAFKDLADSYMHFYNTYNQNPQTQESFDTTIDVIKNILSLDPAPITGATNTLIDLVRVLENTTVVEEELNYSITGFNEATIDDTLEHTSIKEDTLSIKVDGVIIKAKDNKNEKIVGSDVRDGNIDYNTGRIHFVLRKAPARGAKITCTYSDMSGKGPNPWNLFAEGQELSNIGLEGMEGLADNLRLVNDIYRETPDIDDFTGYVNSIFTAMKTGDKDVEVIVQEMIDFLEKPDDDPNSVWSTEKELADWLVADPEKKLITQYIIEQLYPMIKNPILENASSEEKNFIVRGKSILDRQAEIFAETPAHRAQSAGGSGTDDTLFTKWFIEGLSLDLDWYDRLEDVEIFDFQNNDLLKWTQNNLIAKLNATLSLNNSPGGITQAKIKKLLWDNYTFQEKSGANHPRTGLFRVTTPGKKTVDATDGPFIKMAKLYSDDLSTKAFRKQMNEILNAEEQTKTIHSSYGENSENQIESIATNIQLHLLSHYYSPEEKKWALTCEDGYNYFGDYNRNLQSLLGNLTIAMRNMIMDNENGITPDPANPSHEKMSLLSEMLYTMAGASGLLDGTNAPNELSLKNCLKSMGSKLWKGDNVTVNSTFAGNTISVELKTLGNDSVTRRSSLVSGEAAQTYATQLDMTVIELLQPGIFKSRTGSNGKSDRYYGRFSSSQGDTVGILDSEGKLNTATWCLSEISLNCWEGYGPYTYRGKAPNGSDCKYKNFFNSDWYQMNRQISAIPGNTSKGPGMYNGESRYRVYEAIYRPNEGDTAHFESAKDTDNNEYLDSKGKPIAKKGCLRDNGASYATPNWTRPVVLDCASREEAIRKNFKWLLNQKKYQYLIPTHAPFDKGIDVRLVIKIHVPLRVELYNITTISGNGLMGLANAHRYRSSSSGIQDNAKWGKTGLNSNKEVTIGGKLNYPLDARSIGTTGDDSRTFQFANVSFNDGDYIVAMDYTYLYTIEGVLGNVLKAFNIEESLINSALSMSNEIWNCLGDFTVLPAVVSKNFTVFDQIANAEYQWADISSLPDTNKLTNNIEKFRTFYTTYYPAQPGDKNVLDKYKEKKIKLSELPPVPRINGVTYPVEMDGSAVWVQHTGGTRGKYEDFIGIFVAMMGTLHEDGKVKKFTDPGNNQYVTDQNNDTFAYYALDGFRSHMTHVIDMITGFNETKSSTVFPGGLTTWLNGSMAPLTNDEVAVYDSQLNAYARPEYNKDAVLNQLVDFNMATDSTLAGSRLGIFPELLKSRYANFSYLDPIVDDVEKAIKHGVRTYLNNLEFNAATKTWESRFLLSTAIKKDGTIDPANMDDLPSYYTGTGGAINPAIDWDVPINRLRYLTDNASLSQLESSLDFVRDLSKDERFIRFIKETIPALNRYLAVKYIDQHYRDTGVTLTMEQARKETIQINLANEDVDTLVTLLNDFDYKKVFDFIKKSGLNDIEKLYNFSFNSWGETLTPVELQDNIDEINATLIKFLGVNPKEGIIEGVYEIRTDAVIVPDGFQAGETVYGLGKYVEVPKNEKGAPDESYDFEDDGTYWKYIAIEESDIFTDVEKRTVDETEYNVVFPGLKKYFTFRTDSPTSFSAQCDDYIDKWFRNGEKSNIECPNMYSLHKFDLRMDWVMREYNNTLLSFTEDDFTTSAATVEDFTIASHTTSHRYERPNTPVDFLFRWGKGINASTELNYVKDSLINKVYNKTITLPNPAKKFNEDYKPTVRAAIADYRQYANDTFFQYAYTIPDPKHPGKNLTLNEAYEVSEAPGTHKHMLNNAAELMAGLLSRRSPYYQTQKLYKAWENFNAAANITPEELIAVQKFSAALLYNEKPYTDVNGNGAYDDGEPFTDSNNNGTYDVNDRYTRMMTNVTSHAPGLMKAFRGKYSNLLDVGLMAFERGGIGDYMVTVMELDSQYKAWDVAKELNFLLNQDIFRDYTYPDTFWWATGSLMNDFADLIEVSAIPQPIDVSGEVQSLFAK